MNLIIKVCMRKIS